MTVVFHAATRLTRLGVMGLAALAAGSAAAQSMTANSASYNAGYGRIAGSENHPVDVSTRDAPEPKPPAPVQMQDGAIHITFGNRANGLITGKILTIRPAVVEDAPVVPVVWVCGTAETPDKMTVKGENKTNIPAAYLPFSCRARLAKK